MRTPATAATALPGGAYQTPNTTVTAGSVITPLPSATACDNPAVASPWNHARLVQTKVRLPSYFSANVQLDLSHPGFDVKYIGGGSYYRYHLSTQLDVHWAPLQSYNIAGHNIDNRWTFNPMEENSFISNEINLISTGDSPFQWVVGAYQFSQQANQPGDAFNPYQPEVNGGTPGHPFTDTFFPPGFFCSARCAWRQRHRHGRRVCAVNHIPHFESQNNIHAKSYRRLRPDRLDGDG
jgi:hypothetical protein